MKGNFQYINAGLAVALTKEWLSKHRKLDFPDSSLSREFIEGLRKCFWPGRCQVLDSKKATNLRFFIDGAHTEESIQECVNWFITETENKTNVTLCLVFSCSITRNPVTLLSHINRSDLPFSSVIFCPFELDRPHTAGIKSLEDMFKESGISPSVPYSTDSKSTWIERQAQVWSCLTCSSHKPLTLKSASESIHYLESLAESLPDKQLCVLVTGSLYLVGSILKALNFSFSSE